MVGRRDNCREDGSQESERDGNGIKGAGGRMVTAW